MVDPPATADRAAPLRVERMSEPLPEPPPRVTVQLPAGARQGRLTRWRQGPDGTWWAQVVVQVPAAAVTPAPGEDYAQVPRETAAPTPVQYVMVAGVGSPRRAEIHRADCFVPPKRSTITQRVTPMPTPAAARDMLRFDDTTACDVCQPEP